MAYKNLSRIYKVCGHYDSALVVRDPNHHEIVRIFLSVEYMIYCRVLSNSYVNYAWCFISKDRVESFLNGDELKNVLAFYKACPGKIYEIL